MSTSWPRVLHIGTAVVLYLMQSYFISKLLVMIVSTIYTNSLYMLLYLCLAAFILSYRLFFHCRTALPILPSEVDEDSEDEDHPPPWISTKMTEVHIT